MTCKPESRAGLARTEATASARTPAPLLRIAAPLLDAGIGGLMLVIALWFWVKAAAIQSHSRGLMGPLAFPKGISALLAVCALLLIGRSLIPSRAAVAGALVTIERPWFVLAAMGMTIGYPLLIGALGYYLATGLWLPPFLWIAGYRKPVGMALATLGFLIFTRIIFQHVLGTPMP